MRARRVGEDGVLVQCAGASEVRAAYALAREEEAVDVVPAARTVLLDGVPDPDGLVSRILGWEPAEHAAPAGDLVEVPVRYDGPDLADVAELWGVSVQEAVARHREAEYVVAFCGFAPGFAYCSGLSPQYAVPRLDSPRTRVPAGSVGLADAWTGVYPTASPGGWRLLGRTDLPLWDAGREPPALLAPGTRVRFLDA